MTDCAGQKNEVQRPKA